MSDVIALGLSHYPFFARSDAQMADILKWTLEDPDIPAEAKDPATWPAAMRQEWGNDEGLSSAAEHRERMAENMRRLRKSVDEFQPDVIVVWGDDQHENFHADLIPAFSVLAYPDIDVTPWTKDDKSIPNFWGEEPQKEFRVRGNQDFAKQLCAGLIDSGIDIAYAYEPLHFPGLAHAFMNTVLFLDYDRTGFNYPVIPFAVNCYGSRVISYRGGRSRLAERSRPKDPPGPSPKRCIEVGRATARAAAASGLKVALIASSSWSHAFLTDATWRLRPDTEADRRLYDALISGDCDVWDSVTTADIEYSGQQEVLNWFCLVGAVRELGLKLRYSDFVETAVFNSNKVFTHYS